MAERTRAAAPRARAARRGAGAGARRRAIYDDEKEARRAALLAAARQLFLKRDGRLATVTEVADRAGVAKGTVYLYFRTKEELYVTRFEELMIGLLAAIRAASADRGVDLRARIVRAICGYVAAERDFLRLGGLMNGVLEQNLADDFVEAYKARLGEALVATAVAVGDALALPSEVSSRLLLQSWAITVGLWQQADLPRIVQKLLDRRPDLGFYRIDFARELECALALVWQQDAAPPE